MPPQVIIIGAGVIGCACAHVLSAAGADVSVFDTRQIGQGASQASAGVLAPYIEGHESGRLRELGRRSLDLYDDFIAGVMDASGTTVQYTRNGTLEIAVEDDEADRLRAAGSTLRGQGINAEWFDGAALRDVEPLVAPRARGGLRIGMHGFVGVPDLTNSLATAAMLQGARFEVESRVISVAPADDGRITVETENGASFADRVVLAAGSWATQVRIVGVRQPVDIKPIRGQLLHLAWPTTQPIRHVLWGAECYIVPWVNGRVLVGATVEDAGFDERATAAGVRHLLEAGCALVPQLSQASFAEVRVGLRPASPDPLPIVGASSVIPGLVYAAGHYRNGVLLAPLTAMLVKDVVFNTNTTDPALVVLGPSRLGEL